MGHVGNGKKYRGVVILERKEGCMLNGLIKRIVPTCTIRTSLNLEQSEKAA